MNENEKKNIIRQQKELHDSELEKVAGGQIRIYNDGVPIDDDGEKDKHRDGGATGEW